MLEQTEEGEERGERETHAGSGQRARESRAAGHGFRVFLAAALSLCGRRRRILILRRDGDGIPLFKLVRRCPRGVSICPHGLSRDESVDLLEDRLERRAHVAVGQSGRLDEEQLVLQGAEYRRRDGQGTRTRER